MRQEDQQPIPSRTALVVVNYGSHRLIEEALGGLGLSAGDFAVVVVDNLSTPDERAAARELCTRAGWRFVAREDNAGFAAGVNAGLAEGLRLGCRSFVLLNPDVRPSLDVLSQLRELVIREPDVVASPRLRQPGGAIEFAGSALDLGTGRIRGARAARRPGERLEPWLPATCLAFSAALLERTGSMAEGYFMYWEDVEFSHRCLAAGARLVVRDDLEVIHTGGGTQQRAERQPKSALYYRYNCRNRLVFAARNLERRDLLRWIVHTPAVSWAILMQGGRRQLLHSPRPLLAMLAGTASGLLLAGRALLLRRPVWRPA